MFRRIVNQMAFIVLGGGFVLGNLSVQADEPQSLDSGSNALRGVVVTADGKPVQGATVAMSTAPEMFFFGNRGFVQAYGDQERALLFFTRPNTKTYGMAWQTDLEGRFEMTDFRPGRYYVVAGHHEFGLRMLGEVDLVVGVNGPLQIELEPGAFLEVLTRDKEIQSASSEIAPARKKRGFLESPRHMVALKAIRPPESDGTFERMWSQVTAYPEAGHCRLGPLPTPGTYQVALKEWSVKRTHEVTLRSAMVKMARPGEIISVDLSAPAGGYSLHGRLIDDQSEPLGDVAVELVLDADGHVRIGALSDADGGYRLNDVPAGEYKLALLRRRPSPG
jgi:hypothetical protein